MIVGLFINLKSFWEPFGYENFPWIEYFLQEINKLHIWMKIICYVSFVRHLSNVDMKKLSIKLLLRVTEIALCQKWHSMIFFSIRLVVVYAICSRIRPIVYVFLSPLCHL
jgi:hypothetical protein